MATPQQATTTTSDPGPVTASAHYLHGAAAGLLGAATLAVWFFYLDFSRGRMLYTPTVLGTALFRGTGAVTSPQNMQPDLALTAMFTIVHGLLFVLIGIVAAHLLRLSERRRRFLVIILVLFVFFQLGFVAFAMTFSAVALDALSGPEVIFGNLLAACLMTSYFWRSRPRREADED
jgi:hypothetical protein